MIHCIAINKYKKLSGKLGNEIEISQFKVHPLSFNFLIQIEVRLHGEIMSFWWLIIMITRINFTLHQFPNHYLVYIEIFNICPQNVLGWCIIYQWLWARNTGLRIHGL